VALAVGLQRTTTVMGHNYFMTIAVRVLGPVSITDDGDGDGTPVSPKLRIMLAMLTAHRGSVVSADRLCDALWGDDQPLAAMATLQSHVSRLRRLLQPSGRLAARDGGYLLEIPNGAVDVDHFVQLTDRASSAEDPQAAADLLGAALEIWQGPAFGELADREWIRPEAVRLDELRLSVTERWFECRLEHGLDPSLISDLESAMLTNPYRERFVRQAMVAFVRAGRHAEALRRASEFRRNVRDDLGVDPSAELTAVEARVLADDPGLLGASLARRGRNVVDDPSRLVGRSNDLAAIATAIVEGPLVTLLGPGGVGKTRLARRIAATATGFTDGVAFVELAAMSDASSLPDAVATALDVQPHQHLSMEDTLLAVLAEHHRLVVFDNCEHLLDTLVPFIDRVRQRCPHVHILTTSREPLGVRGEQVLPIAPLAVGDPTVVNPIDISSAPAVELLLDRVAAAAPGFTMTDANAVTMSEICRRLDGLPLALELVAARFRSLSPETILSRVMVPSTVLGTSMRSSDRRHRTLRDTITWSFELLTSSEQAVYAQLSTFAGSFDLPAIESVCAGRHHTTAVREPEEDVVAIVAALVDKSMVQMVGHHGGRYQLLETLREYGRERLAEHGTIEVIEQRHLLWFVNFAEQASIGLTGSDEASWAERIDWDFDNLRLAFGKAVSMGDVDAALRLTAALREYSFRAIRYELAAWATTAVAMPGAEDHPQYATVLAIVGYGHFVRGNLHQSIDVAQRAVIVANEMGVDTKGLAERTLVNAWFYLGNADEALRWGDRMLASARDGSPSRLAHALYMRSVAETSVGRTVQGAIMAGEASATARTSGSPTALAQASYALGLALERTDATESLRLLRESARLASSVGNRWIEAFADTEVWWLEARYGDVLTALRGSGVVIETWNRGGDWANLRLSLRRVFGLLVRLGDHRSAALLHGALEASGAASALPFEPNDAHDVDRSVQNLRTSLGQAEYDAAVAAGASLSDPELVHFILTRVKTYTGARDGTDRLAYQSGLPIKR